MPIPAATRPHREVWVVSLLGLVSVGILTAMTRFQKSSVRMLAAMGVLAVSSAAPAGEVFKLYIEATGVYQVTWEDLEHAGLDGRKPATASIGLENRGDAVPVWIDDGDDGRFDPGDRIQFIGERLLTPRGDLDEYSRFNCYVLSLNHQAPIHATKAVAAASSNQGEGVGLEIRRHLERDLVMVRFRPSADEILSRWYWGRLSVTDTEPFAVDVDLPDLRQPGLDQESVEVRISFRGWSTPRHREAGGVADHVVEITSPKGVVATGEWNQQDGHIVSATVDPDPTGENRVRLEVRVPKRTYPESGDLIVDVVLVDWIEIDYPAQANGAGEPVEVWPVTASTAAMSTIGLRGGGTVWTRRGDRRTTNSEYLQVASADLEKGVFVGDRERVPRPDEIILDGRSDLRSVTRRADYIMITHRDLRSAVEPLAELHRRRGLDVVVVDVQDIFDEFNGGIVHPRAIRDFLEFAWTSWQRPAPRFVLLAGDASWDYKNATADDRRYADWTYEPRDVRNFIKNGSTPYAEGAELNHRNLVPTWSYPTYEGHAASDNWFVCLDGDDDLPEMAIGRIPVVTGDELRGVVSKIVAAVDHPEVGPWRRDVLFITNESVSFQRRSDTTAAEVTQRGFVPFRIYPMSEEKANEKHTQTILDRMNAGVELIQFLGHGGRYIWRTGPPDLKKNHDLFTLEDLDRLEPNRKLPVVLSLTCYSAPFDHPTADSIGEKLLRMPDRGAIAVFAASWRNSPSAEMGRIVINELTTPGATIGEAILRAKRQIRNPMLVQTYNLLGDPAVPVLAPHDHLQIEISTDRVTAVVTAALSPPRASLRVEWTDGAGTVVAGRDVELIGGAAVVEPDPRVAAVATGVRAYGWDRTTGWDAIGWAEVTRSEIEDAAAETAGHVAEADAGPAKEEEAR